MPGRPVAAHAAPGPGHLGSHTSPVSLGFGVLIALLLLVIPGAIVARVGRLTWPTAVAVGPALTYGVVALAIVPFGALGVPWNAWTALFALAIVAGVALCLRIVLARFRDVDAEAPRGVVAGPRSWWPQACVLGAAADRFGGASRDAATGNPFRAPGMPSGTPTRFASSSTPARRRRPTWASCATSRPTKRCTTRRRFTRSPRCSASSPAPRRPPRTRSTRWRPRSGCSRSAPRR